MTNLEWYQNMINKLHVGTQDHHLSKHFYKEYGLGLSTIYIDFMNCYQTALFDSNGWHPVENHETEGDAKVGHMRWVKELPKLDGRSIIRIGTGMRIKPFIMPEYFIVKKVK